MLFHVKMTVNIPHGEGPEKVDRFKAQEKTFALGLQNSGKWLHLWRIAGLYANYSVFDVDSVQELHDLLLQLPLYPYMAIEVTAMCRHPSSIREDDPNRHLYLRAH
ncbi:muconolactone Delta-isomerase [Pseudomonas tolaasii]